VNSILGSILHMLRKFFAIVIFSISYRKNYEPYLACAEAEDSDTIRLHE